jgi:methyl-accepting chemotaxis protein
MIGAIYLVSLQVEARSQRSADDFATLALLTGKVSESLLQGRELATQFLQKPDDKKLATHNEIVNFTVSYLPEVERLSGALPENDPIRKAGSFRAAINNYTTRFAIVASAQKLIGFNEDDVCRANCGAQSIPLKGSSRNTISRDWPC